MAIELIEKVELAVSGTVSITSIPQDGTDLLLLISDRRSTTSIAQQIQLSGDTTFGAYDDQELRADGGGVSANADSDSAFSWFTDRSSDTADTFGFAEIYISDYTSSSYKKIQTLAVSENNASAAYRMAIAGVWENTGAVTSISTQQTVVAGSVVSLYKITAA